MTTTLLQLAHHIASLQPSALPSPAIGTRLSFRLIYPDTASGYSSRLPPDQTPRPQFLSKDLGSLVLGEGGPGIDIEDEDANNGDTIMSAHPPKETSAATKTLADAKFVVGDYLSVAVLPPDESTGAVVPAAAVAEAESGVGRAGSLSSALGGVAPPPGRRDNGFPVGPARGRGRGWRGGSGREWDGGSGRGRERDHGHNSFPEGEWRRGERLPEGPRGGRRGSRW